MNTNAQSVMGLALDVLGWEPCRRFFVFPVHHPRKPALPGLNGKAAARRIFRRIGGEEYSQALQEITRLGTKRVNGSAAADFPPFGTTRVLVLGGAGLPFQQWCGINVIFN